ncbi:hypothetical protein PN466_09645 [Roseofilum reptotaenium CS-1145]|uniref:Uncharacterized protein n=1 Tax=Roseofilum reptotaenium AO1-A TaxID=1925591 RepID=A0A1L9QN25_9CYAN|nr:hypothetical protein [Roseofilum reptotaenium]MDB9517210.1 hypothetical protein [Roseofilum reptotaenium CS-1145]OJJ22750.1 hypothetical protein BI308_19050 [Roseofilum reptotaenium AO1-A]
MVLQVEQAVSQARLYFEKLLPQLGEGIEDLQLEEVEFSEDKWLITLGYTRPTKIKQNPLLPVADNWQYERVYKIFTINSKTNEVESMKIRELST